MPQFPSHIFGMHDPGAENLFTNATKSGWITVTVKVNPPDHNGDFSALANAGLGVIVRLNNGYGSDGTIPFAAQYSTFAQQCAAFVAASHGAKIWIIGNETNMVAERPGNTGGANNDGEVITPDLYARCFANCRREIKQRSGHANDWIAPAAPAPWNNQTQYSGNGDGDWVKYFQDILSQCVQLNAPPDALALHTYTHGFDANLITSDEKMGAPFQNRNKHFRTYRDFIGVIPSALRTLPIFITETQAADPDWWQNRNIGWIQAAKKERKSTIGTWRKQTSRSKPSASFAGSAATVAGALPTRAHCRTIFAPRSKTIIACAGARSCSQPIHSPPLRLPPRNNCRGCRSTPMPRCTASRRQTTSAIRRLTNSISPSPVKRTSVKCSTAALCTSSAAIGATSSGSRSR